jgi:DNA-binding CsgD family transcriptional regulator
MGVDQENDLMQCTALTRSGDRCPMRATENGLCFSHFQISQQVEFYGVPCAEIFTWPAGDVAYRIRCLTPKQIQALELLCSGMTYERAGEVLGICYGTLANRLSLARKRAGVRTVQELVALYAAWRARKAGESMP